MFCQFYGIRILERKINADQDPECCPKQTNFTNEKIPQKQLKLCYRDWVTRWIEIFLDKYG
jgi:hypothetical protein